MHYARGQGVEDIVRKLMELGPRRVPRFEPDEGWMPLNS